MTFTEEQTKFNGLTEEQTKLLNEPLVSENVSNRDGTGSSKLSYLASHHVISEANRIFGFDGWSTEILTLKQVDKTEYEKPPYKPTDKPKEMISIVYLCTLRLTVGDVTKEDTGFGDGVAGRTAYGIGSCIELASKEAVTDALKRCLRYFGNQFGNTLYNKEAAPLPDMGAVELSKPVTEDQLKALTDLYVDRDINDEWVTNLLKAENFEGEINDLNQEWYEHILKLVTNYKLTEIKAKSYKEDIESIIVMMEKSVNMNMLKSLFKEIWTKSTEQKDKDTQVKAQKIYNELKEKFEAQK